MYNDLEIKVDNIIFIFRVQSYDIFPIVVSLAYGKYSKEGNKETSEYQQYKKSRASRPMENFPERHGKAIQQKALAGICEGLSHILYRRFLCLEVYSERETMELRAATIL